MDVPIKVWLPYTNTSPTIINDIVQMLCRNISLAMVMRVHNLTKEELQATITANKQAIYWTVLKCKCTNHTGNCGSYDLELGALNTLPFEKRADQTELILEANNDSGDIQKLYAVDPDLSFFAGLSS